MGEGKGPRRAKMGGLIAAKIACCAVLLLWAAGALGGLGAWFGARFADGGAVVGLLAVVALALVLLAGRRLVRSRRGQAADEAAIRRRPAR